MLTRIKGGFQLSIFGCNIMVMNNLTRRHDYIPFDKNISLGYVDRNPYFEIYDECLVHTQMQWTDNVYKRHRVYSFLQLAETSLEDCSEGDVVEFGVWRGLSSRMLGLLCKKHNFDEKLILVDSFEGGLSDKTANDENALYTQTANQIKLEKEQFSSSEHDLKQVMSEFNFVEIYNGWVPDILSDIKTEKIRFLHLDMDLYQPTKDALLNCWPKIVSNGIVCFDDYNSSQFPGVTKVFDEFITTVESEIRLAYRVPMGGAFILKV